MSSLRSLLFASSPSSSDDQSILAGADAIILEGSGAVVPALPSGDRPERPLRFFRLGRDDDAYLGMVIAARPDGIVLAGAEHGADLQRFSAMIAAHEAMTGIEDGATAIIALLTTPGGLLALNTLRGASARLCGIGFDAVELAVATGTDPRGDDGRLTEPLRVARALVLAAAADARVPAFDAAFSPAADPVALAAEAAAARRDGFTGKFAVDPIQVALINRAFTGP
jgi:citrate lyase subunit beta / citryl-CoA lyase